MVIKDFITKNKKVILAIVAIIFLIAILLLISYYQLEISEQNYLVGLKLDNKDYKIDKLDDLERGSVITQEFIAKYNNLEKITFEINIDTKKDYSNEYLKVIVKDAEEKIIKEECISYDVLMVKNTYELNFEKQKKSKGKKYFLVLQLDQKSINTQNEDQSVVSIKNSNKKLDQCLLTLNDKEIEGSIYIIDKYESKSRTLIFNVTAIGLAILVFGVSIYIYISKKISEEKVFLIVVPILCILFLIFVPMFLNHDEYRHWLRAYEISEGNFIADIEGDKLGTYLPASVSEIYTNQQIYKNIKYNTIKEFWKENIDENNKKFVDTSRVATYSPIQYLPETIGIIIAKELTNKTIIIAYAARISSMITCLFIMYMAIKTIPFGKNVLLLISIIPITVEGFVGITGDGLLISASCMLIAYILKLRFNSENKINLKNKFILFILTLIISFCKTVYLPFFFLLLLLPKSIFKNNKDRWLTILLISIITVSLGISWYVVSNSKLEQVSNIETQLKVQKIVKNPIYFLQIFLHSVNVNGQKYFNTMFGGQLGWKEIKIHFAIPFGLFILSVVSAITDKELKKKLKKWEIVDFIIVILGIVGIIFLALYVSWSDISSDVIEGIQGRYFLPILPLLLFVIGRSLKIEGKYKEENVTKFISILGIIIYIYIILIMVSNFLK